MIKKEFYENGKIRKMTAIKNGLKMQEKEFYETGETKTIRTFHKNGQLKVEEVFFKNKEIKNRAVLNEKGEIEFLGTTIVLDVAPNGENNIDNHLIKREYGDKKEYYLGTRTITEEEYNKFFKTK